MQLAEGRREICEIERALQPGISCVDQACERNGQLTAGGDLHGAREIRRREARAVELQLAVGDGDTPDDFGVVDRARDSEIGVRGTAGGDAADEGTHNSQIENSRETEIDRPARREIYSAR